MSVVDSDLNVVYFEEEERFSRRKDGALAFTAETVLRGLDEANVCPEEISVLSLASLQEKYRDRNWPPLNNNLPFIWTELYASLRDSIVAQLPNLESIHAFSHHLCHAASAYFSSGASSAAVVTLDGVGETETGAIWRADGRYLNRISSWSAPASLGFFYEAMATWSGMTGREKEGKYMALSARGVPRYQNLLHGIALSPDDKAGFRVHEALRRVPFTVEDWTNELERHLGPRRRQHEVFTQRHYDVAASTQAVLESSVMSVIQIAGRVVPNEPMCCLAGGVFMNSVANGRIRRDGPFSTIFIPPVAGDPGLSLGAAYLAAVNSMEGSRRVSEPAAKLTKARFNPYVGSSIAHNLDREILESHNFRVVKHLGANIASAASDLIVEEGAIGWVQGRGEAGPRALGNRSILGDARNLQVRDTINEIVKHRELWRPFAPVVREEDLLRYLGAGAAPSPYMTFVDPVNSNAKQQLPAAIHVDQTARYQTVSMNDNPRLHELISAFDRATGCGGLINTSLNTSSMPIVRGLEDCMDVLLTSGLKHMVIGNYVVEKPESMVTESKFVIRGGPLSILGIDPEKSAILDVNGSGLSDSQLSVIRGLFGAYYGLRKSDFIVDRWQGIRLTTSSLEKLAPILAKSANVVLVCPLKVSLARRWFNGIIQLFENISGSACSRLVLTDDVGDCTEVDCTSPGALPAAAGAEEMWINDPDRIFRSARVTQRTLEW